jgi:energy-coupling factor transporter ATP-binding protein EcfA2
MGQLVFIVGPSGSGKSTSGRNLDPATTGIINSDQKALPFKAFNSSYNEEKGNYVKTSETKGCVGALKTFHKKKEVKVVLLDTWSRIMTDAVMNPEFRGEKGFGKWGEFSASQYDLINIINDKLRDNMIVYVMAHPDSVTDDFGAVSQKIAVQGKQLEKFVPESFSSIVLYTEVQKIHGEPNRHVFRTRSSGTDTCKTPIDMFEEEYIDNDLTIVDKAIREYYEL